MSAQVVFYAVFALAAILTYPKFVLQLALLWLAFVLIKLVW